MRKRCVFVLLIFIFPGILRSGNNTSSRYPKWEVRAVWLATVAGLDWPSSHNPDEQKKSLSDIVERLSNAHYNTIYFQVRGRGDAMYHSSYEPWSQQLTGTIGKDPGWDPLEFIVREAHAHNMEVHAWFNTFLVKNGNGSGSLNVANIHPEWVHSVGGETWLDPGIPAARQYTLKVALEIVRDYDIDGFHFDFMRYPEKGFSDDAIYRRYGNRNISKSDWRRKNINTFIAAFYDSATSIKPRLKVGSAPIGIYQNTAGVNGLQSYTNLYQDSREWLRQGWQDYIVPQVYWALGRSGGHPDFALVAKDWSANTFGRQVYLGVGVYKPDVAVQVPSIIDTTRSMGFYGNAYFRYEHINKSLAVGGRYDYASFIPPMPWKDSIPPNSPRRLHVQAFAGNYFNLKWNTPAPSKDGDAVKQYNIYRSTEPNVDINDIQNFIKCIDGTVESYTDTISRAESARYVYAVTAMDSGNNESLPSREERVMIPEVAQLSKQFSNRFKLEDCYAASPSKYVYFTYELSDHSPVWLTIIDKSGTEILKIVDAYQRPGKYIAAAKIEDLKSGDYTCRLTAGEKVLQRTFLVEH
ncbi:MAG: glycoside hydrolase family 10 protein [Bacteroidota bacterium]